MKVDYGQMYKESVSDFPANTGLGTGTAFGDTWNRKWRTEKEEVSIDHSDSDLIKNDKRIVLKEDPQIIQRRAMAELCSLLLNLNEFVYVD